MDSGYAVAVIIIFFCLQYPNNGNVGIDTIQSWWGNTVYTETADYLGTPLIKLAKGEWFGPATWSG